MPKMACPSRPPASGGHRSPRCCRDLFSHRASSQPIISQRKTLSRFRPLGRQLKSRVEPGMLSIDLHRLPGSRLPLRLATSKDARRGA